MTSDDEALIEAAIVRLRARILALVFGLSGGTLLFLATASLLIQRGPNLGANLRLLSNYCPGYTVTWPGAFVGFLYGCLYGGLTGYLVSRIYNRAALRNVRRASTRS